LFTLAFVFTSGLSLLSCQRYSTNRKLHISCQIVWTRIMHSGVKVLQMFQNKRSRFCVKLNLNHNLLRLKTIQSHSLKFQACDISIVRISLLEKKNGREICYLATSVNSVCLNSDHSENFLPFGYHKSHGWKKPTRIIFPLLWGPDMKRTSEAASFINRRPLW